MRAVADMIGSSYRQRLVKVSDLRFKTRVSAAVAVVAMTLVTLRAVRGLLVRSESRAPAFAPPELVSPHPFYPAFGDLDQDGDLDLVGARNPRDGGPLRPLDPAAAGLAAAFSPGRGERDNRLADLDLDGDLDVVCNGYAAFSDRATRALLFWNRGDGTFSRDPAFEELDIRGHGETIVVFDYDNDGDLDVFLPFYSYEDPAAHSWLLENLGDGRFRDVADRAGVALRRIIKSYRVEGAQAADLDGDGLLDLYASSHLFLNRGDGTFVDVRADAGLPVQFDEGMRFTDANSDGELDIVLQPSEASPVLFEQEPVPGSRGAPRFRRRADAIPHVPSVHRFALNLADLDNDGDEDMVIGMSSVDGGQILVHDGDRFVPVGGLGPVPERWAIDSVAAGDLDGDGRLDLAVRDVTTPGQARLLVYRNRTPGAGRAIRVRVLGPDGVRNQHGRVARLRVPGRPGYTQTRVVDGGAGYLSQGEYDLHFATDAAAAEIAVRYASGEARFPARAGDRLSVSPDGSVRSIARSPAR